MPQALASEKVREAFRDIIQGKAVKRARHSLVHEGVDLTSAFLDELKRLGYQPATVATVNVKPGERVPAFLVEGAEAYFGWVFWEQFTSWKIRKLWGSVVKNKKGDWDLQVPDTRPTTVYVNEALKIEMDIDHPPEF